MAKKPIDRWLGLGGVALGILLYLLPKTPLIVAVCVVAIFGLLAHPFWNFWWIEDYIRRRIAAIFLLAAGCVLVGYIAWPTKEANLTLDQVKTSKRIEEIANAVGENASREKLLARYPCGYLTFDVDYKNSVYPYDTQLLDQYDLNWNVVKLTRIGTDRFDLRLPDFKQKGGGWWINRPAHRRTITSRLCGRGLYRRAKGVG